MKKPGVLVRCHATDRCERWGGSQVAKPEISHYDGQESNGGERRGGRTSRYDKKDTAASILSLPAQAPPFSLLPSPLSPLLLSASVKFSNLIW